MKANTRFSTPLEMTSLEGVSCRGIFYTIGIIINNNNPAVLRDREKAQDDRSGKDDR